MTDREKLLELLDEFKNTIVILMDEKDKLEDEGEELRTGRREAEEKVWAAEEKVKELTKELEKTSEAKTKAEEKANSLKEELDTLKSQVQEVESSKTGEIEELRKERDSLKKEMDEINEQLSRVSELYREASAEKEALQEKVDLSDLLAIYITLIETAFYGKPHARILYTLHDVKTAITRKNIAASSGIQPAVVRKAVYDLVNADLVKVDEESDEVKLIKDILRRG
ncbi:hypothetical protein EU527_08290 [Candidatus Thorarchaeota archaeon]|nr:MAG: hypothetical protein EU527_08290 [Candidatus Thorarchaeota archaeon]